MKIISKYKDYYDGAHGWVSKQPIYIRKRQEYYFNELDNKTKNILKPILQLRNNMPRIDYFRMIHNVVVFCGKAYPHYSTCQSDQDRQTFYTTRDIERYCNNLIKKKYDTNITDARETLNQLNGLERYCTYRNIFIRDKLTHKSWEGFKKNNNLNISVEIHKQIKSPIFLIYSNVNNFYDVKLIINPMLKNYNFMTQMSPFEAYQELEMYLGNQMVQQMDHNIKRSDELIRDSKGFDKWSFRKKKK
jgi:hypothetical protein